MTRQAFPVFTCDVAVAATVAERALSLNGIDTTNLGSGVLATITTGALAGNLYRLDVTSAEAPDGTTVIAPLMGPGRWLLISTGSGAGVESTLAIFDGQEAGLVWDGSVDNQVRFFDVTGGSPGTQVGADQTEAPFAVTTGALSAEDRRLYNVEVDDVVVGQIEVYVLNHIEYVETIATATKTASSDTLDLVTTSDVDADSEWLRVGIASDNITTTYNKDGDILSVVVDPGGSGIEMRKSWQRTAGFSPEGAAPFGVTAGSFWLAPGTTIPAGTTIRITFDGALPVATAIVEKFSKDSRTRIVASAPSLALSPLNTQVANPPVLPTELTAVAETLWDLVFGREGGAVSQIPYAADWTTYTQVTAGAGNEGIGWRGARRLATGLASGDPSPGNPDANTEYSTGITGYYATIEGQLVPSP